MSKIIEFFLGSILITILSIALMVFSALHYMLKGSNVVDCAWHGSARTWIDSNGDGLVNKGEPPLSEVEIHIDDVQNKLIDVGWPAITNQNGDVELDVPMPKCSDSIFEIYAHTPEGYRITTMPRIEVSWDFWGSLSPQSVYYFGFDSNK
ncbi:MAG TPA: hypothetical protein VFC02_27140 [Anaerolineales bacterium]|nr:hypothetical protein [Anaerolineales bacterium]